MACSFPTGLLSCSHYHQDSGRHPNPMPLCGDFELVELVTAGRGWVEHEGQWVEVAVGSLLWHVPGDRSIARSDFDDPYRCLAVRFAVEPVTDRRAKRVSHWPEQDAVRLFAQQAVEHFVDERFDRSALLPYIYGQLLFQAHRDHHRTLGSDLPRGLARVLEVIETCYDQPLSLQDLADTAGWSVAHLHDVFRRQQRMSPHQALIARRLRASRQQLVSTHQSIKQIARSCGFSSASAFCRRFKHATAQTPAAYRQRYASTGELKH